MYIDNSTKLIEASTQKTTDEINRSKQILKDKKGIIASGLSEIETYVKGFKYGKKYVVGDVIALANAQEVSGGLKVLKVVK